MTKQLLSATVTPTGTGYLVAALLLSSCGRLVPIESDHADQADGGGAGGEVTNQADAELPQGPCTSTPALAPTRIMLLSDAQYVNAVRDVLGVQLSGEVAETVPANGEYYYRRGETAEVSRTALEAYFTASQTVAAKIEICATSKLDETCAEQFLRIKLPRLWRRPVTDDEIANIMALFRDGLQISPDRAVEILIEAMLNAGSFLYRSEIGNDASSGTAPVALTAYELASALSFILLDSVPDDELWSKAVDGSLVDRAVLSAQADRLLALPAAQANLKKKVSFYLGFEKAPFIAKDPRAFPQYTRSLRDSLYQGAQMFLDDIYARGQFRDLYTSNRYYVNQEVAALYGIPGVTGSIITSVTFEGDERKGGILTQPLFLAATNRFYNDDDVVGRGLFVYERFACGSPIGDPPAEESEVFRTLSGNTREKWLAVDKRSCGTCHTLFDPIGISSLKYDAIGRYRASYPDTMEPIDTTAVIERYGADFDGPVSSINDVAKRLAAGQRPSDCAAVHLASYALDHEMAGTSSCALQALKNELAKNGSFSLLFKAIVTSPAFLTRNLGTQ